MTLSNNPFGVDPLTFNEPNFLLDPNDTENSTTPASSLNFEPDAPSVAPAQELPPLNEEHPAPVAPAEFNLLKELQKVTSADEESSAVSKGELAAVLEGFARVLRGDFGATDGAIADKNAEIMQLKELLLEAQETIIGLLNDRVFDRAKISRLEAEVRLLPDLQSQASRAMGLAMRSEDVQKELIHVRSEVERLRTSYIKSDKGIFGRIFGKR